MNTDVEFEDELDAYLAEALRDPQFRAAYEAAEARAKMMAPRPLAIDGREYQRRQRARRKHR